MNAGDCVVLKAGSLIRFQFCTIVLMRINNNQTYLPHKKSRSYYVKKRRLGFVNLLNDSFDRGLKTERCHGGPKEKKFDCGCQS